MNSQSSTFQSEPGSFPKSVLKWALLVISYLFITSLSGLITSNLIPIPAPESLPTSWPQLILIAIAELLVLDFIVKHSHKTGLKLILSVFIIYWGTQSFMMLIEAAFYLNLWQPIPLMSWQSLSFAALHGVLSGLGICAATTVITLNLNSKTKKLEPLPESNRSLPPLKPLMYTALTYMPVYLLAGLLLAIPLGGEAFDKAYSEMTVPAWMPLFQIGRGVFWAVIIWVIITSLPEEKSRSTAAFALAIFGSVQLLHPNPYMLEQLRAAHIIEVSTSMGIFGWIASGYFTSPLTPAVSPDKKH